MATLTCDICGSELTADTAGDFAICELCGAKKVLEKAKPAETEPEPDDRVTSRDSSTVPPERENAGLEKRADNTALDPANYVIPQKFSNAPFERTKADLERKINDVNINTIDLRSGISKANNTAKQCERDLRGLEQDMSSRLAAVEHTKSLWADDPYDPRFAEGMQNHNRHICDIQLRYRQTEAKMENALGQIPSFENEIARNDRKLVTLRAELENVKDELRRTPAQRAEEYYQQLLNEKRTASTEDDFAALGTKFNEIECYRDAKALKNECIREAVKKGYDNMVSAKKTLDSKPSATDEEYKLIARNVRLIREFNIDELIQQCEDLVSECESAATEACYKQLIADKNKTSTDEKEYRVLAERFKAMNGYKDTAKLADDCDERYIKLKERREERERQERERKRQEEERERQEEERGRQEQYDRLVQSMDAASTEEGYRRAAEDFRAMGGYKDTAALANRCEERHNNLRAQREEQERKEREAARRRAGNRRLIGFASVVVLAMGAVAVYFVTRPSVESLFDTGKEYFESDNFTSATAYFSKAIKRSPRDAAFRDWRGRAYLGQSDYKSAAADFSEAARLAPNEVEYHSRLGETYYNMKNYDGAVTAYTNAIRLDPSNALYYCNRADAYGDKNAGGAAIADYTQAITLDPSNARYRNSRGGELRKAEEYERAIADHTEAIRLNPSEARYYNNRGVVHVIKKDYPKAIPDFTEAIRLAPDNARYRNNRGDARILIKDIAGAAADYRAAVQLDRDNEKYRRNLEKTEQRLAEQQAKQLRGR